MHVVVRGLARDFFGRGEQRPDVDIKTDVRERSCDDLLATVMAVLAHLRDKDARPAAVGLGELVDELGSGLDVRPLSDFVAVDAGNGTYLCLVTSVNLLQRVGDLPDGGLGTRGVDGQGEQIPLPLSRPGELRKCGVDLRLVPFVAQLPQFSQLLRTYFA